MLFFLKRNSLPLEEQILSIKSCPDRDWRQKLPVVAFPVSLSIYLNMYEFTSMIFTGRHSAVGRSRARGLGFDNWSIHIFSFLLPLIQEGRCQLLHVHEVLVSGLGGLSLPRKSVVWLTWSRHEHRCLPWM